MVVFSEETSRVILMALLKSAVVIVWLRKASWYPFLKNTDSAIDAVFTLEEMKQTMSRSGLISPDKDEICYIMLNHLFGIYETPIDYSYQKTRAESIKLSEL